MNFVFFSESRDARLSHNRVWSGVGRAGGNANRDLREICARSARRENTEATLHCTTNDDSTITAGDKNGRDSTANMVAPHLFREGQVHFGSSDHHMDHLANSSSGVPEKGKRKIVAPAVSDAYTQGSITSLPQKLQSSDGKRKKNRVCTCVVHGKGQHFSLSIHLQNPNWVYSKPLCAEEQRTAKGMTTPHVLRDCALTNGANIV